MSCWFPIKLNREKNHLLPPIIEYVPCSKCIGCIERKRAEWTFRLTQELYDSSSAAFVTLTYNEDNVTETVSKKDLQKYLKRVHSKNPEVKYYAVAEYGPRTERPHYHIIVYNADNSVLLDKWSKGRGNNKSPIGHIKIGKANRASIHYVTGYLLEKGKRIDFDTGQIVDDDLRGFNLASKGLGKIYLKHAAKIHKSSLSDSLIWQDFKMKLPRYYKDKIFTPEEKKLIKKVDATETIQDQKNEREYKRQIHKHIKKSKDL